jgi:hypothetical protein
MHLLLLLATLAIIATFINVAVRAAPIDTAAAPVFDRRSANPYNKPITNTGNSPKTLDDPH